MYKAGDHYADWKNLTPFPVGWNKSKVGDLVVLLHTCWSNTPGEILMVDQDNSTCPNLVGPKNPVGKRICPRSSDTAPLPQQTQKPESASIFLPHFMSDLITKLKTALKGEPSRTMIAAGVEAMDGSLTADGIKLVDDRMRSEWYKANKEALAKEIKALEKEKK